MWSRDWTSQKSGMTQAGRLIVHMRQLGHTSHVRRTHCSGSRLPQCNADSSRPSCVEMVQPTHQRKLDYLAYLGCLDWARLGRVLAEG